MPFSLKMSQEVFQTKMNQTKARPSSGLNDHVKMAVPSLVGDVNIVSPISYFVLKTLIKCFFPPCYTENKTVKFVSRNRPPMLRVRMFEG